MGAGSDLYSSSTCTWTMENGSQPLSVDLDGTSIGPMLEGATGFALTGGRTSSDQSNMMTGYVTFTYNTGSIVGTATADTAGAYWEAVFNLSWSVELGDWMVCGGILAECGCAAEPEQSSTLTIEIYDFFGGSLLSTLDIQFHGQAGWPVQSYPGCDGCADIYQDGVFLQQDCGDWSH